MIPYGAVTRQMVEDAASKASYEKYALSEERRKAARRAKREQAKTTALAQEGQGILFSAEDLAPIDRMLDNFVGAFK